MDPAEYAIFVAVVFGVNLMPAFGPPTWLVIVFFGVTYSLALVPLVLLGATAAAAGRYILALASRAFRDRMSPERIADLDVLREDLESNRTTAYGGVALFLLSPLPSAQMFEAAGVTGVPLKPLIAAFWLGRLVSYTIYASAATLAAESFTEVFSDGLRSPWAIALNVVMIAVVILVARLPWAKLLSRNHDRQA